MSINQGTDGDFLGGPAVKTLYFLIQGDTSLIPGQGIKVPHAVWVHPKIFLRKKKSENRWSY